ncbi:hypothetical protein BpOF4_21654 (plasmid) [Alkalihalophilus pseudofirmus OF4]|uniref:Uncharacterized protein n=2 Tax=Alkalihalophilus TaxID=2893060 RepID=D3G1V0_ALKPO|nr:hypothetical protein BpOF4_21654 [Alkalihalophilus pseudofirmus OF4]ERN51513.1 hypothetical protein A33I_20295 [Alkalihalophilus marmarensis DSM 21297]
MQATPLEEGKEVAERVRTEIEQTPYLYGSSP